MKQIITTILILTFTIQSAFADQAVTVRAGDIIKPEYDKGTLFDREKAEKIKDELIEKDGLVKQVESYDKTIKLYRSNEEILNGQKDMLLKQNIELTKTLNDTRETSDWLKVGYFVLGIGVAGIAVYGASRLSK